MIMDLLFYNVTLVPGGILPDGDRFLSVNDNYGSNAPIGLSQA
jgi:hypothetical protein